MITLQIAKYNEETETWDELKDLWEIMMPDPHADGYDFDWEDLTRPEKILKAAKLLMLPTKYTVNNETYCRNADRTANFELESITNINNKSKPEFVWEYLKPLYLSRLLTYVGFKHNYKDNSGNVVPEEAPKLKVSYVDLLELRTIECYLGATIEAELVEHDDIQYWREVRLAFPER